MEENKRRFLSDPMWRQVSVFLLVMFFVFLADSMLSDFVPGFIQNVLGSPLKMGLVMSTSSMAGFVLDLLFARVLRNLNVGKMVILSFVGCVMFVGLLILATFWPWVPIIVMAMLMWGLYYEFFGFSSQKFVVGIAAPQQRTAVWAVIETLRAIAYALGPIGLAWAITMGEVASLLLVLAILCAGFLIFSLIKTTYKTERLVEHQQITMWHELKHWRVLFVHIWPMVILGVTLAMIDAVYWTTGTLVNDALAKENPLGGLFMTVYMLSAVAVGVVFGRREVKKGKKKLAELLTLASGVVLISITLIQAWWWYLIVVFVSSVLSALAWPLIDAVYTDLLARMGRENIHMIGLKNSSNSIAYMIGPVLAGAMATIAGELPSFRYLGWFLIVVSSLLLIFTPKRLKLPQTEIQSWE